AGALRRMGIRQGERIGIFMPMCPEVAVSVLAAAKIGAVIIPLFSGYGPEAIATRLRDGEAKVLICADGFCRRGQVVPMKETPDRADGCDGGPGDVVFWYTDTGWMMGPWLIFGTLLLGATMVLYEGTPDFPAADRLWRMVDHHKVTVLGVSPTLVRGLMTHGDE